METPTLSRALRAAMLKIEVYSEIPDGLRVPLIANAAGVLHYIEDYQNSISQLVGLRPEFIVVSQLPVSDLPTYVRLQLNVPNKKIPQWVMNRADFIGEFKNQGYSLCLAVDHDFGLTHAQAPGPSQLTSMVFRRVD